MDNIDTERFYFLPKGSSTPHIQGRYSKGYEAFVIPKLDEDMIIECVGVGEDGQCFFKINRGYYCKKHRV